MTELLVVLCTVPSEAEGKRIADSALEAKAAACVNLIPGITSLYRWEGKKEESAEVLLVFKTTSAEYARLEMLLRREHPYQTPEIVALPAARVYEGYLQWVSTEVSH